MEASTRNTVGSSSGRVGSVVARAAVALLALAAAIGALPAPIGDQALPASAQTPLVPDVPATGYPVIQHAGQYDVYAANQVGNYILSGGDFQQVRLQNGTLINQPYFTAWHINTKQIICTNITFDGEVLEIIPANEPNTAYVAGRFRNITAPNGTFKRSKLVKIDLPSCNVDTTFDVQGTWGKVSELALTGNRLFVAGDFSQINNTQVAYLAELDANTGNVNTNFNLNVVKGQYTTFRGIGVNPAGTRLVLGGRWSSISGVATGPTAVVNIANPASPFLTGHRSSGMVPTVDLQDASVSPDGTRIALVYGTATTSDYAYLIEALEQPVTYTWRKYLRDSAFGVGMTDDIVYVSGHFCKIDEGPGPTDVMSPNGLDFCSGVFFQGGAWRTQLAALDANTGTPLTWNPGNNSFRGGRDVTVTERGLLVGYDGDRTNNIAVGPLAFFDLGGGGGGDDGGDDDGGGDDGGGGDDVGDGGCTVTITGATATLNWDAVDGDPTYQIRKDGSWLASTSATTFIDSPASLDTTYLIRYWQGGRNDIECTNIDGGDGDAGGGGGPSCVKSAAAGGVLLEWDPIPGIGTYYVRLDDSWLATVDGTSYVDGGGFLGGDYLIRYWSNGANDIFCTA